MTRDLIQTRITFVYVFCIKKLWKALCGLKMDPRGRLIEDEMYEVDMDAETEIAIMASLERGHSLADAEFFNEFDDDFDDDDIQ